MAAVSVVALSRTSKSDDAFSKGRPALHACVSRTASSNGSSRFPKIHWLYLRPTRAPSNDSAFSIDLCSTLNKQFFVHHFQTRRHLNGEINKAGNMLVHVHSRCNLS